jgi:hypothetical protein
MTAKKKAAKGQKGPKGPWKMDKKVRINVRLEPDIAEALEGQANKTATIERALRRELKLPKAR